jgi:hypothetical protein
VSVATERPAVAAAAPPPPGGRPAIRDARGWLALAGLLVVAFAMLLYLGRSTSFYFDEWDWILGRRDWDVDALLAPHNEHLSLAPVLVFKALFSTVGIDSYVPYRVAGLAIHCGVAVLLFSYARRRVGDVLALAAAATVLFLGTAWPDVLWPFQIGFLGSLAAGIGALLALDREDRRGDVTAAVLLAVALSSSSLGIALLFAAALEVLGRPDRRARWWVIAAPAVLYGAWYVGYGGSSAATSDNLFGSPAYVAEAAAGASAALFSLGRDWGRTLAVGLLVALLVSLHRRGHASWRLIALIAAPLGFWFLTAVARGQLGEPASPRYLYPGAVLLLLIAAEAAAGVRLTRGALAVGSVILAGALLGNVGAMREGAGFLRDESTAVDGALAALPLVAARVGPDFQPDPDSAPQIRAGAYLDAVRDLGSPAPSPRALPGMYERARASADEELRRALSPRPTANDGAPAGAAPKVDFVQVASQQAKGACQTVASQGGAAVVDVVVPPGGLLLRPVADSFTVSLRRFSDAYGDEPIATVPAGGRQVLLQLPTDASPVPWHARLAFGGSVRACARG